MALAERKPRHPGGSDVKDEELTDGCGLASADDGRAAGFRAFGKSKDHRDGLPLTHFKIDYKGRTVSDTMVAMASPPESTMTSLRQRLQAPAHDRWAPAGQCCHAPPRRVRLRC